MRIKTELLRKMVTALSAFMAFMAISVGKYILGGVMIFFAFGMWYVFGGGSYNDRNLYTKIAETKNDMTLDALYENLRGISTPLGKCWRGSSDRYGEDCIFFGPGIFKDFIAITKGKPGFILNSSTELEYIDKNADNAHRFENILDTSALEVTPKRFSGFASYKLITAVLMEDLTKLIAKIDNGEKPPEELDMYELYHYNSSDLVVRDSEDNEYAKCSSVFEPLSVIVYSMDGEELAHVTGDRKDEKSGYQVTMSGEEYGIFYQDSSKEHDMIYADTPDGRFTATCFRAVRKGNIGSNYVIDLDGVPKAVIGGSRRIRFDNEGLVENDIICSYDDDYLLMYIAMQEFIMTKHKWIK